MIFYSASSGFFGVFFVPIIWHYNQLRWIDSSGLFPFVTWDCFVSHWLASLFAAFCSGKHTLSVKRRQVQHFSPSNFCPDFDCWDVGTSSSRGPRFLLFSSGAARPGGTSPGPAFTANQNKATLFQNVSLRTGRQLFEAQEERGWENFSSVSLFYKHLQVSAIKRRVLQENSVCTAAWKNPSNIVSFDWPFCNSWDSVWNSN